MSRPTLLMTYYYCALSEIYNAYYDFLEQIEKEENPTKKRYLEKLNQYGVQLDEIIKNYIKKHNSTCYCLVIARDYCKAEVHNCLCFKYPAKDQEELETYLCYRHPVIEGEHQKDGELKLKKVLEDSVIQGLLRLIRDFQEKKAPTFCICRFVTQKEFCHSNIHVCRCRKIGLEWEITPAEDCYSQNHKCYCPTRPYYRFYTKLRTDTCNASEHNCACVVGKENFCRASPENHNCICSNTDLIDRECISTNHQCICLVRVQLKRIRKPCMRTNNHICICVEHFNKNCLSTTHNCLCLTKTYRFQPHHCSKKGFRVENHLCRCGKGEGCFSENHKCIGALKRAMGRVFQGIATEEDKLYLKKEGIVRQIIDKFKKKEKMVCLKNQKRLSEVHQAFLDGLKPHGIALPIEIVQIIIGNCCSEQ